MTLRARLKLPKEHGAWAILYVSFMVGALVASSVSLRLLLLLLSVTFVFIGRESFLTWWRMRNRGRADRSSRRFMIAYLALGGLSVAPLLVFDHLYWLVVFGLVTVLLLGANAQQAVRREDRTISSELMAIGGLTLTAPAAHYVSRGFFEPTALCLWFLCLFYFSSSVFYVKLRVATINPHRKEARKQSSWQCAVYHLILLASLLILAFTGNLNLFALAAFSPVLGRSFWQLASPVRRVNLRKVGWFEVAYSIVFLVFTTLTFRF
jgi:YwiC-like protein